MAKRSSPLAAPSTRQEVVGGLTTFFTTLYIVVVNPAILATEGTGIAFSGALTATVLLCFGMTLFMGLYAKLPYVVAPGMGINAFFTFSVVLGAGVPWQVALGMVFWSGVLFLLVSVTPMREMVAKAIPKHLRVALAAGIGVFLTFIGLKNAGLVIGDPVTLVTVGRFDERTLLAVGGLIVMTALWLRKSPFAFLVGMALVTAGAWALSLVAWPESPVSMPDFGSAFLQLDLAGALQLAYLPTIAALFFTDLFDSISTFVGVSHASGLVDRDGEPLRLRQGLIVDATATLLAGPLGTSSGTAYIESAAGIEAGARGGLAAVVCAVCFLPLLFLGPMAAMVPDYATAPVLILVGAAMFRGLVSVSVSQLEDVIPMYLTVVLIPLTFSITQGVLWGFISHTVLYLLRGRWRDLHPVMLGLALLSVGLLVLQNR